MEHNQTHQTSYLTTKNAEFAALRALSSGAGPACLGLRFDRGLTGGVTVTLNGTALGAWRFAEGCYHFSRMSTQRIVARVSSPEQVVSRTIAMAAQRPEPGGQRSSQV